MQRRHRENQIKDSIGEGPGGVRSIMGEQSVAYVFLGVGHGVGGNVKSRDRATRYGVRELIEQKALAAAHFQHARPLGQIIGPGHGPGHGQPTPVVAVAAKTVAPVPVEKIPVIAAGHFHAVHLVVVHAPQPVTPGAAVQGGKKMVFFAHVRPSAPRPGAPGLPR